MRHGGVADWGRPATRLPLPGRAEQPGRRLSPPAALSPAAPAISIRCGEIKEFQSEALECLAASQLSHEEVNAIVVAGSVPHSGNGHSRSPAPFSLQGDCPAVSGSPAHLVTSTQSAGHIYLPHREAVGFVTFSTRWPVAWSLLSGAVWTEPEPVSEKGLWWIPGAVRSRPGCRTSHWRAW